MDAAFGKIVVVVAVDRALKIVVEVVVEVFEMKIDYGKIVVVADRVFGMKIDCCFCADTCLVVVGNFFDMVVETTFGMAD